MGEDLIQFGETRKLEPSVSTVFAYDGANVTFAKKDGVVMVNATQMAKPFGKKAADWLKTDYVKDFINTMTEVKKINSSDLLRVTYGNNGGTWMHEDVAIEFARWLSPAFAIWCNDRIKELLTVGMTATQPTLEAMLDNPDLVIGLATKLKQQREENQRLIEENHQKQALIAQQAEKIQKDAPKVEHHDMFMGAEHGEKDVSVRKFLSQAGIKGEKDFWHWFEYEKKIIYRDSLKNPVPYAEYRYLFSMPDRHNDKNNWSGIQLMVNPTGKVELAKMYYKDHPGNFLENSKIKQLVLWQ